MKRSVVNQGPKVLTNEEVAAIEALSERFNSSKDPLNPVYSDRERNSARHPLELAIENAVYRLGKHPRYSGHYVNLSCIAGVPRRTKITLRAVNAISDQIVADTLPPTSIARRHH